MFFLNKKTSLFIILILFVLIKSAFAASPPVFIYSDDIEALKHSFKQFEDKNFDCYLKDITGYNFKDYSSAVFLLFSRYRNDADKLNICAKSVSQQEKNYDNTWINDLISFAGKNYVKKNTKEIQQLIFNISSRQHLNTCLELKKNVIFSEYLYSSAVKDFFSHYISYTETLSNLNTGFPEKKKSVALNTIELLKEPPYQAILRFSKIGEFLNTTNNVDLKPEVADFIINHPKLNKPFALMSVITDLRELSSEE